MVTRSASALHWVKTRLGTGGEGGGSGWMNCSCCNGGYQQMHGIQEMRDLQHVAAFDRMHPLR